MSQHRKFDEQALQAFREDPNFQYILNEEKQDAWSNFLKWLFSLFDWWPDVDLNLPEWLFYALLYGIIAFAIVMIIYSLNKDGIRALFYNTRTVEDIAISEIDGDAGITNWEELIENALSQGQHAIALRLLYLQTLHQLDIAGIISWKKDKTNRQYMSEIESGDLKSAFSSMTWIYEYAWYGKFKINVETYQKALSDHHKIEKLIS